MKIVFSAVDVKEMVQLFLEEHTSFETDSLDIAIVDGQIHVGIDEDLDTVVTEVQEEQLELDLMPAPIMPAPKKRRGRKPKEVVVVESEDEAPIELATTVEEKVEEVAEEVTTAVEETVADLDEQLVEAADNLFDEPVSTEEEHTATPVDDVFDPSKPLFG